MFRSIRWRLVLSFQLLTLVTVSSIGVLALALVQRNIGQQETAHLTANAEAVARQARTLIWPTVHHQELQELVETSSFLGDARIRVLNAKQEPLADSWSSEPGDEQVWVLPAAELRIQIAEALPRAYLFGLPTADEPWLSDITIDLPAILEQWPSGEELTGIRWWSDAWGSRFSFHALRDAEDVQALVRDQQTADRSARVVVVPVGDEESPVGYVEISRGPDVGGQAMNAARRAFLIAGAVTMLMAVALGLVVSRRLSAPLHELTSVASRMSSGNLSVRAHVGSRDEIGLLAAQFNQMAEQLEVSFSELAAERDALRRFVSDASHELRTPITALWSFNELMQGAAAEDPEARAEFLAESSVQLERLQWITSNLFDLSRLDGGLVELDLVWHDLGALIESACSGFRLIAQEKGITLTVPSVDPPVAVKCDRRRIELALSNLLDNAIKFTSPGGSVEVGAEQSHEAVRMWVNDSGQGIRAEDQPYIFDRFFRGTDAGTDGSGLGLAVVRSVVQAHGGRVLVKTKPGLGSRFTIELPSR